MVSENEKITRVDIEQTMKTTYIDYAMSVIVARALPDVRDGFKPVHRRILTDMYAVTPTRHVSQHSRLQRKTRHLLHRRISRNS